MTRPINLGRTQRECFCCKKTFMATHNQRYCSVGCREKDYGIVSEFKGVATATVGAIQEYRVVIDLLSKGFEVFRATSPSCSCDILVLKENKMIKVEVRTAYKSISGKFIYPKNNIKADILALVLPKGEIKYLPENF